MQNYSARKELNKPSTHAHLGTSASIRDIVYGSISTALCADPEHSHRGGGPGNFV